MTQTLKVVITPIIGKNVEFTGVSNVSYDDTFLVMRLGDTTNFIKLDSIGSFLVVKEDLLQ